MLFVTLQMDTMTMQDSQATARGILDYHKKHPCLNDTQYEQLHAIAKPTLDNQQDIRLVERYWHELVETLVIYNDKGTPMRFVADEVGRVLYFGDEEGIKNAKDFHDNPKPLSQPFHHL